MKYLKNFNQLINESVEDDNNLTLRAIIKKMFETFKTKDALTEIWDKDSLEIATDVYDSFIDLKELMELKEEDLQSFADNLGIGGEDDILISIYEKMYNDKFKRLLKKDIDLCINTLEDFIKNKKNTEELSKLSTVYLTELEKIKDNL